MLVPSDSSTMDIRGVASPGALVSLFSVVESMQQGSPAVLETTSDCVHLSLGVSPATSSGVGRAEISDRGDTSVVYSFGVCGQELTGGGPLGGTEVASEHGDPRQI